MIDWLVEKPLVEKSQVVFLFIKYTVWYFLFIFG
jgi:hypothetical protein